MNDRYLKVRKGTNLVELMAVILIIGILVVGFATSYAKNIKKANRDQTVNELSVFSTSFGDAYYDLGIQHFDPASQVDDFKSFLSTLERGYVSCTFDLESVNPTTNGFTVMVKSPLSVYESQYKCWFTTKEGAASLVMIACAGEDGNFSEGTYGLKEYGDDIVLVVSPKE